MGYEALIDTLLKEGEARCREILGKARSESETILREAKERLDRLEQQKKEELAKQLQAERSRILNRARVEARQILLKAKYEVLDQIFARAEETLRNWVKKNDGKEKARRIFVRLVEEALPEEGRDTLRAILHEEGPQEIERIFHEKGISCEKVKDPVLWLGFRLISDGGKAVVTNSYQSRLEKIRPDLLVDLNALLFGEG